MPAIIRVHQTGGPEVLAYEDAEAPKPGSGQALIRQEAIGINYIDTYFRSGLYPQPIPFTPGSEGAGTVVAVGEGVSEVKAGDRVAYAGPIGGYAAERVIAADRLVVLPDDISAEQAAAMMLKGMTAQYLLRRTFRVGREHTILVHAAAGGVGSILIQWARHLGAKIIGTAGSPEKMELARQLGCDHVVASRDKDWAEQAVEATGGDKCDVVYDGVGKATFPGSLDCLKPLGMWVSFGSASGPVEAFPVSLLQQKGSLFATRPTMNHYVAAREDLLASAGELFGVVGSGAVKIPVQKRYALKDARKAHEDLEGRQTTGSAVLIP